MKSLPDFIETTYLFPPHFSFLQNTEINFKQLPPKEKQQILDGHLFLLYNGLNEIILQVNPTIKTFLESFKNPQTLKEVIKAFAKELNQHPSEIVKTLADFAVDMLQKGLIVEYNSELEKEQEVFVEQKLKIGDIFHDIKITKIIYDDTCNKVYVGKPLDTNEQVIIKTLHLNPSDNEEEQDQKRLKFIQEFSFQQKLSTHPNVCKVLQLNTEVENPFAVLEFIEGENLKHYILENQQLTLDQRIKLIQKILAVGANLHKKNILHGDLHYHNFLVTKEQEIKIIDFGFANNANPDPSEFIHYGGILKFLPPERIDKDVFVLFSEKSQFTSEVFQFGLLAFFILYSEMPFTGFTWKALATEIQEKEPFFHSTTNNEQIPTTLIKTIKKALQKKSINRFQNAIEFSKELNLFYSLHKTG